MYSNAYQNGACFQVWDAKVDPAKNAFYKQLSKTTPNQNARAFDKDVKSYLHSLQGQNTRMILPAQDNKTLSLHQRFLVLHIFIPVGFQWWVQIGMSDIAGIKRRINLTTVQGKQQGKYFSYRYPLEVTKGSWLFLGIDVFSFMNAFKDQTFRTLDHITVGSSCRLRRIFTMKEFVQYQIPNGYWLTQELSQSLQLVEFKEPKLPLSNKQLTQSISSPKRQQGIKKSLSGSKRQQAKQINRSDFSPRKGGSKVINSHMIKSQFIIQNARQRLQDLQKQEEILVKKSRQFQASPKFKQNSSPKYGNKKSQSHHLESIKEHPFQKKGFADKAKASPKADKIKLAKGKLPQIQKPFKEDQALNLLFEEQSSAHTQENIGGLSHKFLESKQAIEEDHWTSSNRGESRPISEAISTFSNIRAISGKSALNNNMFPSTVITKQNNKQIILTKNKLELELIYDEMAGCYYHPETNSYYQIKP